MGEGERTEEFRLSELFFLALEWKFSFPNVGQTPFSKYWWDDREAEVMFLSKEGSGEWTIYWAPRQNTFPGSEFERKGHRLLNHLCVPSEMSIIGSSSPVVASPGNALSSWSDLFHGRALRTKLPPRLLAFTQRPSHIHLCCLPLTK